MPLTRAKWLHIFRIMIELTLPSLGEDVQSGIVVSILVKEGDQVSLDQPLMEVETDKVTAEVPAEHAGTVMAILVKIGDEIPSGAPIMQLEGVSVEAPVQNSNGKTKEVVIELEQTEAQTPLQKVPLPPPPVTPSPSLPKAPIEHQSPAKGKFRASPLARKMAREIGIDILAVTTHRPSGRISVQDVKDYAKQLNQGAGKQIHTAIPKLPDFSKWGPVSTSPMSGIMQATSKTMSQAWQQIPHAWLQEKADITQLEEKRQAYKEQVKSAGGRLTLTSILVKVAAKTLEQFPIFNASVEPVKQEIIYKDYIHIGVAVDTPRGLVVPKIEHANQKTLTEIAIELSELSAKARENKVALADLQGATFTISNLGGIGTTAMFPIVKFPEVAILGISASEMEPVWIDGSFQPRLRMPLTIGFDHRIINGADAARFIQHLKNLLEDWFLWNL